MKTAGHPGMRRFLNLPIWSTLFFTILFFCQCKKPQDKLGPDKDLADAGLSAHYVDTTFKITVVRDTFFRSDRALYGILGSLWDPIFGITTASIYTNFRLNQIYASGVGIVDKVDSVILCLPYASPRFYGDISKYRGLQTVQVYELEDSLELRPQGTRGYPYDTVLAVKPAVIGQHTFIPRVYDSVVVNGLKEPPQLRLRLDPAFGYKLLTQNPTALSDDGLFRQFFKGLYIKATPAPALGFGAFLFFNMPSAATYLKIYYNDTSVFELGVRESNVWVNQFVHNYSVSQLPFQNQQQFESMQLAYLQPMGGCRLKLNIALPYSVQKSEALAISKAEIILPVAENVQGNKALPQILGMFIIRKEGSLGVLEDAAGMAYVAGIWDEKKKHYVFNITQHIVKMRSGQIENLPLLVDYVEYKASRADAVIFYGPQLFPAISAPRLRIYFSSIP